MRPFELPLTETQRDVLIEEARQMQGSWVTFAPYLFRALDELRSADPVPAKPGVATVDSLVRLRTLPEGSVERWVLVMPDEADPNAGRLSVLSPLGWAVLGTRKEDRLVVPSEDGFDRYVIERVDAADPDACGTSAYEGRPWHPEPQRAL